MSEKAPLTSDRMVDVATDVINDLRAKEVLTYAEIVMILDTAKIIQIQKAMLESQSIQ